jgi:hypothetical protein
LVRKKSGITFALPNAERAAGEGLKRRVAKGFEGEEKRVAEKKLQKVFGEKEKVFYLCNPNRKAIGALKKANAAGA